MTERVKYVPSPSYPQIDVGSDGSIFGVRGKLLKHFPDKRGYRRINLYLGPNQWKQVGVHGLVCEAFHGPKPSPKHGVAHVDGNPANNHKDNLRWATQKENEADKKLHGRSLIGERHHQSKISESDAAAIKYSKEGSFLLAKRYHITPSMVWKIRTGRSWSHV